MKLLSLLLNCKNPGFYSTIDLWFLIKHRPHTLLDIRGSVRIFGKEVPAWKNVASIGKRQADKCQEKKEMHKGGVLCLRSWSKSKPAPSRKPSHKSSALPITSCWATLPGTKDTCSCSRGISKTETQNLTKRNSGKSERCSALFLSTAQNQKGAHSNSISCNNKQSNIYEFNSTLRWKYHS